MEEKITKQRIMKWQRVWTSKNMKWHFGYWFTKEQFPGVIGVVNTLRIYYGKRYHVFCWKTPPQ